MTENEIREMYKSLAYGAEWECKCNRHRTCSHCEVGVCYNETWRPYKLGEAIHENFEYRKVKKWCVTAFNHNYSACLKCGLTKNAKIYFEGTKEECEKWIEEHPKKTWLEGYIEDNATLDYRAMAYMMSKEVCKKILEEVKNNCFKSWMPQVSEDVYNVLKNLIKELGVEV